MKYHRLLLACLIALLTPLVALAAPGDPRLVVGVLEWPRSLTNEPIVIVRGDDNVLYYVSVTGARREGAVVAGARVALLGIEGRTAHEVTAIGFGHGSTPEAALASLQGGARQQPAAAAAPVTPPAGAAAAAPTPSPAAPSAASTAPAAPATAATPNPNGASTTVATPTPTVAPATAATPATPTPAAANPAPASTPTPATNGAPTGATPAIAPPHAPLVAPPANTVQRGAVSGPVANGTPAATSPAPPATHVPAAMPVPAATAPMVPVDDRRWTELTGEVESFIGRTLVLKVDGGRVMVDVSSLSGNLERMVAPGSKVKVYGVPVEMRFKAMGFIDPDARGRGR